MCYSVYLEHSYCYSAYDQPLIIERSPPLAPPCLKEPLPINVYPILLHSQALSSGIICLLIDLLVIILSPNRM